MDGLLYACISNNLAHGIGSFWFPHYSKTLYPFFDQQPPLGFFLQSLFFRIFGSSIYVERIYSFSTAIITAYLINLLFRIINKEQPEIKNLSWIPVLLWIIMPSCFWSYSNNMLENTMSIFDLMAIIFTLKFFHQKSFVFLMCSGVFIFLATLTKGFPGMFPLVGIFAGWIAYKNMSFFKMIQYSLIVFLIPCVIYFILLQNPLILQSLSTYLHHRVFNSIQHVSLVGNRFHILYFLILELIPVIFLLFLSFTIFKLLNFKSGVSISHLQKHILFCLLIAASTSLPLMITLEQRAVYLVPSFPYIAIAFTFMISPIAILFIERIQVHHFSFRIFKAFTILSLISVLTISIFKIGKTGRDVDMIHDVHLIGETIPRGSILGSTRALWEMWSLQEYLVRHYSIYQRDRIVPEDEYLILKKDSQISSDIKIEKVNFPTTTYHLYKVIK